MSVAIAPRRLARRSDHHGYGRLRPVADDDTGAVALALPRGFHYRELSTPVSEAGAARLHGVRYDGAVCRRVDGIVQALAVRGRPGFSAAEAIIGLAYRTEWVLPGLPEAAALGTPHGVAAVGDRILLAAGDELWAFEPRGPLGGVLNLLERRADAPALVGALGPRAFLAAGHELRLRDADGAEHPLVRVLTGGAVPIAARPGDGVLRLDVAAQDAAPRSFALRGPLRT
ncbi:MAG TPA: hypothetical protein VH276_06570 [Solirubrobacteraceae bacterium]|jgi:hypothetical protein|nr:hypothetical protein [Solirubrobacteraceae bacterium]